MVVPALVESRCIQILCQLLVGERVDCRHPNRELFPPNLSWFERFVYALRLPGVLIVILGVILHFAIFLRERIGRIEEKFLGLDRPSLLEYWVFGLLAMIITIGIGILLRKRSIEHIRRYRYYLDILQIRWNALQNALIVLWDREQIVMKKIPGYHSSLDPSFETHLHELLPNLEMLYTMNFGVGGDIEGDIRKTRESLEMLEEEIRCANVLVGIYISMANNQELTRQFLHS